MKYAFVSIFLGLDAMERVLHRVKSEGMDSFGKDYLSPLTAKGSSVEDMIKGKRSPMESLISTIKNL